ncbi:MAG: MarR family transcriptional regulator [Spirochaetes bacterium]|nr:MarR family transcriptional regulator [Spirochaetota bacterium]
MDETTVITLIARIHERADAFLVEELSRHGMAGLVPSHGDILYVLFTRGDLAMNEIAALIHRTRPTVTVLVGRLVELGYVVKVPDPDDGRVTRISLTAAGRALKPALVGISKRLLDRVYGGMKKRDRVALCRLLEAVRENL